MSLLGTLGLVALGGAAGGVLRVWVTALVGRAAGEGFPWGTLVVNVTGAAGIGLAGGLLLQGGERYDLATWLGLVTGTLGSYTTVSSFALQVLALVRERRRRAALAYVALSVGLCLAAAGGAWAAAAALV